MSIEFAIHSFCAENIGTENNWYSWKPINETLLPQGIAIPAGNEYERNIALKNALSAAYKTAGRSRKIELTNYYIAIWGGVRANDVSTITSYSLSDEAALTQLGSSGIASWSKALCIRDPNNYCIFDARVSVAIHCLAILTCTEIDCWMPTLTSQNKRISEANKWLRSSGKVRRKTSYKNTNFYERYLLACRQISSRLGCPLSAVEMLLFTGAFDLYSLVRGIDTSQSDSSNQSIVSHFDFDRSAFVLPQTDDIHT